MINKSTRILTVLTIIFLTFFSVVFASLKQEEIFFNIGKSDTVKIVEIPINHGINESAFANWADKAYQHKVSISIDIDGTRYYNYRNFSDDLFSILDQKINGDYTLLTTKYSANPSEFTIATIPLLNDYTKYSLNFGLLKNANLDEGFYGRVTLYSNSSNAIERVIDELSDVVKFDLSDNQTNVIVPNDTKTYIGVLFIVLTIIFLISIISTTFGILNRSKQVGVMKILGYSTVSIWKRVIAEYLKVYIAMSLFSIIITTFYMKGISLLLLKYQSLFLLVLLIISVTSITIAACVILRKYSISSLVKNQKATTNVLSLVVLMKFIFVLILIPLVNNSISMVKTSIQLKSKFEIYTKYTELFTFESYSKDIGVISDPNNGILNPGYPRFDTEIFYNDILKRLNGYYADFSSFNCDDGFVTEKSLNCSRDKFAIGIVNDTYLKDYNLKESDLTEAFFNNKLILMIPSNLKSEEMNIIEDATYFLNDLSDVENSFLVKFYDDASYYSMDSSYDKSDFLVNNPILIGFNEESLFRLKKDELYFFGRGASTPFQFPMKNEQSIDSIYLKIHPELEKLGLSDNLSKSHIKSTSSLLNESLKNSNIVTMVYSLISILLIVVIAYMSTNIIVMYFMDFKKQIAVKKILGKSDINIFKEFVIIISMTSIVALLCYQLFWYFKGIFVFSSFVSNLVITFGILVLDITIFYIYKKRFFSKNLVNQLKGD